MIVFLASGLWHGASFSFVVWGGLNGLYQVIGEILRPIRNKLVSVLHLDREALGHKLIHIAGTFVLVDFSWIFFRADGFKEALKIIESIITVKNPWVLFDGSLYKCGLDEKNFRLILLGIVILILTDFCKRKGIKIREVIAKQDYWFRWIYFALAISAILTFGIWGPNYNEVNFIYF